MTSNCSSVPYYSVPYYIKRTHDRVVQMYRRGDGTLIATPGMFIQGNFISDDDLRRIWESSIVPPKSESYHHDYHWHSRDSYHYPASPRLLGKNIDPKKQPTEAS